MCVHMYIYIYIYIHMYPADHGIAAWNTPGLFTARVSA